MTTTSAQPASAPSWEAANQRYLLTELERLRLLLQLRVLWLRTQWKDDQLHTYRASVISDERADHLLSGTRRQDERRFLERDAGAGSVRRSLAAVEDELLHQYQAFDSERERPAIDTVVHLFQLSPFARDVLLLCLAPELDPSFERSFAYVQDDIERRHATVHLALALFCHDESAELRGRFALTAQAPLRRYRLIVQDDRASRGMRLTERTRDYMLGINHIDDRVAEWLRPVSPAPLSDAHEAVVDHVIGEVRGKPSWPLIDLVGPAGTGKLAVARAICDRLGLELFELVAGRIGQVPADSHDRLRLLEREAFLGQFAVFINTATSDQDPSVRSAVCNEVERLGLLVIAGSREPLPFRRATLLVTMPPRDACTEVGLWKRALSELPNSVDGHLDHIVQQFHFGPTSIARVVASARSRARALHGPEAPIAPAVLWDACRSEAGAPLDALAQRIASTYTWSDIVLPDDVMQQLQEVAAQVAHRTTVYEGWGFGATLGRGRGISALFSGPSGTGKTMAAEVLAHELRLDLFRIDLSGVVSKYIGETEKNLRKVFDAAEESGAILFFDEADALFGKRSEVKDSHDRYANIEVNYLLQRMEDYRGLAILATNMKSHLDQAFLRRLRFVIEFPFPDAVHRARIWEKVFPPGAPLDGLNYQTLSRLDIPGANIKNIAVNAAFLASGHKDGTIGMEHVFMAARREYAKMEKLPLESEFGGRYSQSRQ
jgi:hypothetical protein